MITLTVVALLAYAATIWVIGSRDDLAPYASESWLGQANNQRRPPEVIRPGPLPVGAVGTVRVVEQGYTQENLLVENTFTPGYGPGRPEPYMPVHGAVILENTDPDHVAVNVSVRVTYTDAAGKEITEYGHDEPGKVVGVRAIWPGERVGIPWFFNIDGPQRVAGMTLGNVGAAWLPIAAIGSRDCRLTADQVKVIPTGTDEVVLYEFVTHSEYAMPVVAAASIVYRDRSGRLLGGTEGWLLVRGDLSHAPGTGRASVLVGSEWLLPGRDDARTEIFLNVEDTTGILRPPGQRLCRAA